MRSLFMVACKVYGLVQVYTGLTYIFTVLPMVRMLTTQSESSGAKTAMSAAFLGEQITLSVISLGAMVVLTFGIAWLLLCRTDWLADRLNIPISDAPPSPSVETLLHAGTRLMGLFVVVQGIPLLIQGFLRVRDITPFGRYAWSMMALPVVRIIIGVFLVIMTGPIVKVIMKKNRQNKGIEDIDA